MEIDSQALTEIRSLISGHIRLTPIVSSACLPGMGLKAENLQLTGSFKIRTALSQILRLSEEERKKGIVTSSSGNFAGAVSYAASLAGISAKIVMMRSSNPVKVLKTKKYGAEVCFCGNSFQERQAMVREIQKAENRVMIYPFDHPDAIAGNASIGFEILEQFPRVRRIIVPVSGGGLISGIAAAVKNRNPNISIIGVQPEGSNASFLSFHRGERVTLDRSNTIADGLRVTEPGRITFPLIQELVDDMVLVSEDSIMAASAKTVFKEKLLAEPSGCVPMAAVLEGKVPPEESVAVVSGGNIDPDIICSLAEMHRVQVQKDSQLS